MVSAKFEQSKAAFLAARTAAYEAMIETQRQLAFSASYEFTPATLAKHEAAMSKIQMQARAMIEAASDAWIECSIAGDDDDAV